MIDLTLLGVQQRRVLAQLRKGPIRAQDFDLPNVIDGGLPIQRVAARVGELVHEHGCQINSRMVPSSVTGSAKVAEYTLISEPESSSCPNLGQAPSSARCAIDDDYDWTEAA